MYAYILKLHKFQTLFNRLELGGRSDNISSYEVADLYLFGCNVSIERSWDGIGSIVTRLWAVWSGARIVARMIGVPFLWNIQTSSGVHPGWYLLSSRSYFLGLKQMGHESDHSTPSNAKVKNDWSYTSTPLCACMVCAGKTLHVMINAVGNFFTVLWSAVVK
jgi:hypothetical protein